MNNIGGKAYEMLLAQLRWQAASAKRQVDIAKARAAGAWRTGYSHGYLDALADVEAAGVMEVRQVSLDILAQRALGVGE